jgi:hypothetical protein
MNTIDSHLQKIKKHLLSGCGISTLYAIKKWKCTRLGARIYDLRQPPHNMNIVTTMVQLDGKRYARYTLKS